MNPSYKKSFVAVLALLILLFAFPSGAYADEDPFASLWTQYAVPSAIARYDENGAGSKGQGVEVPLGNSSGILIHIAFAQLEEQGKIDASSSVQELIGQDVLAHRKNDPISLEDLLNHTVGWENDWREPEGAFELEEYLRRTEPKKAYEAGQVRTAARYCDCIKALICEKVSGMPFDEYVHVHILEPLGMDHTHYVKEGAWPYSGLISTADDMAKLLTALCRNGEGLFEKAETLERMTQRSYSVHPLMPGLARGIPEYPSSSYCVGLDAGNEKACGGLRILPEERKALWIVTGDLGSADEPFFPSYLESLLDGFAGERAVSVKTEGLPLTAPMTGEFIQADRPVGGYMELARDMVGLQIIKSKKYTDSTTTKLYVFSTYYSSQYLNTFRGFTNLYFNLVDQVDDHLFRDVYGNLLYFVTDEEGNVVKFVFEDEEYVPVPAVRSITAVNLTIWVIYLCMIFFTVNLIAQTVIRIHDRMSYWPVDPVSWTVYALSFTELLLGANVCILLHQATHGMTYAACQALLIINWILAGLMIAECVFIIIRWKKSELRQFEKRLYAVSMIMGAVFLIMMFWWWLF